MGLGLCEKIKYLHTLYLSISEYLIVNYYFVLTGKAGGWRDYFDEEMAAEAEKWISDNLKDTDMRFPHLQQ